MKSWRKTFSPHELSGVLFFALSVILLTAYLQQKTLTADLHLELESDQPETFQLYWKHGSKIYSEQNSNKIAIHPLDTKYSISMPYLAEVDCLRIDPLDRTGTMKIRSAKLISSRNEPMDFLPYIDDPHIANSHQLIIRRENDTVLITSFDDDSHFELCLPYADHFNYGRQELLLGGFLFTILLLSILNQRLLRGSKYAGILKITLPPGRLLRVSDNLHPTYNVLPGMRQEKHGKETSYTLQIKNIDPNSINDLIQSLKRDNPQAVIRFQYNRSSEI